MNSRLLVATLAALIVSATALGAWQLPNRADGPSDNARDSLGTQESPDALAPIKLAAPKGEAVLRISGVAKGNAGAHTTKVDFATLDGLARERVTVYEPFVKRELTFTGMPMSELLRAASVPETASNIYMHALDDYHVDLSLAGVASEGFLATRVDGNPIPVAKGGPIRLLFTGDSSLAANTDNWIWSIDRMRVRG